MSESNNFNQEQEWFLSKYPDKPWRVINGWWHPHKSALDEKSWKISKIEQFRYFKKIILDELIRFLNTNKFTFTERSPHWFGIQTSLEWKTVNSRGQPPWENEHLYYIHFSRVLMHRKQPMLTKVYECITNGLWQIKLELTFQAKQRPRNSKSRKHRWLAWRRLAKKLRAINEVKTKFDKRFWWWQKTSFIDHSHYSIDDEIFY